MNILFTLGGISASSPYVIHRKRVLARSAGISLERGTGSNRSYPYVAHPWDYTIHHCFHFENVFTPVFTPLVIFPSPEVVCDYAAPSARSSHDVNKRLRPKLAVPGFGRRSERSGTAFRR